MPRWVYLPLNTPAFPGRTSVRRVFPNTASRPVGQTRPSRATQPSRRAVCLRPSCSPLPSSDPRSVPGDVVRWNTSVRAASAALPRGPRSGPGSSVPVHPRLIGPIRPTRRRIPTSPLCGLYQMPSMCSLRLGDLRVVPRFRCPSFLTCRPLRPRGDRNRFVPDLRFRHRPSRCYEWLGSPDNPAIRFTQGRLFGASWFAFAAACQVARPLCRSDQSSSGHRGFCRVGGGALARWPPSAAQTARADFPHAAFTKTQDLRCKEKQPPSGPFLHPSG